MPFTWKETMRNVVTTPEHEQLARECVIKAVEFMSAAPADARPHWNGATVLVPSDSAAESMFSAITAHMPAELSGGVKHRIVSAAVRISEAVCKRGASVDDAFGELEKRFAKT